MPLISCLALLGLIIGVFAERKNFTSPQWNRGASRVLVQVIYPCLIFSSLLTRFQWAEMVSLARLPLLLFIPLLGGLFFGRMTLGLSGLEARATQRSYVFLSIMPNYSFVPLVVSQMVWGDRGIALVALSSVAADISLWTFAYPQIAGKADWRKLLSPALLTLIVAFTILYRAPDLSQGLWPSGLNVLSWIGRATLPLSMYILGTQLARASRRLNEKKAHSLLLLWRLILCPFLVLLLILAFGRGLPSEAKAILLLVASMPGAVITVVLAQLHEADGRFAATQILFGHILGLFTCGLWQLALFYLAS